MSVILLILGIVVVVAGITTIAFGIPINESPLGSALIIAGTTALTGGLTLIGLFAVVARVRRLTEGLGLRPAARSGRAAEVQEAVQPAPAMMPAPVVAAPAALQGGPLPRAPRILSRPEAPAQSVGAPQSPAAEPSAVEVSAAAIERLRARIPRAQQPRAESLLVADGNEVPASPRAGLPASQPPPPAAEQPPVEPPSVEDRAGGAALEAAKTSRLDFLFSARPRPTLHPQPEESPKEIDQVPRQADHPRRAERVAGEEARGAAIVKSGVADGTTYTLYADGSVKANLAGGTARFNSIAELRAHIESTR
jgi:hypothetical protein